MDPIDELVVRLLGDSTAVLNTYDDVIDATNDVIDVVNEATTEIEDALNGMGEKIVPPDLKPVVDVIDTVVDEVVDASDKVVDALDAIKETTEETTESTEDLEASLEAATKALKAMQEESDKLDKHREQILSFTDRIHRMGVGIHLLAGAVTAILGRVIYSSLQSSMAVQKTERSFAALLGSAESAKEVMQEINSLANHPDLEMGALQRAAKNLAKAKESGAELSSSLKDLSSISVATGMELGHLEAIVNRVRTLNRFSIEDYRQLATSGVISLDEIAKHYNTTREAAERMIREGKLGYSDLRSLLRELSTEGGKAFNALEKQMGDVEASLNRFNDAWGDARKDLGDSFRYLASVGAEFGTVVVQSFRSLPTWLQYTAHGAIGVTAAFAGTVTATAGWLAIVPRLTTALQALGVSQTMVATTATMIAPAMKILAGSAAAAAVVVGPTFLAYRKMMRETRDEIEAMKSQAESTARSLQSSFDKAMSTSVNQTDANKLEKVSDLRSEHENRIDMIKAQQKEYRALQATLEDGKNSWRGGFGFLSGYDGQLEKTAATLGNLEDQLKQVEEQTRKLREEEDRIIHKRPLEQHIQDNKQYVLGLKENISELRHQRTLNHEMSDLAKQDSALLDQMRRRNFSQTEIDDVAIVQEKRRRAEMETRHKIMIDSMTQELHLLGKTKDEITLINMEKEHGNATDIKKVAELQEQLKLQSKIAAATQEARNLNESIPNDLMQMEAMIDLFQSQTNLYDYQNKAHQDAINLQVLRQKGVEEGILSVTEALMKQRQELSKTLEIQEKAKAIRESLKTPTDQIAEEMQVINDLFLAGALTMEEATAAGMKALQNAAQDPLNQKPGNSTVVVGSREDFATQQQDREKQMLSYAKQQITLASTSNGLQTSILERLNNMSFGKAR